MGCWPPRSRAIVAGGRCGAFVHRQQVPLTHHAYSASAKEKFYLLVSHVARHRPMPPSTRTRTRSNIGRRIADEIAENTSALAPHSATARFSPRHYLGPSFLLSLMMAMIGKRFYGYDMPRDTIA